MDGARSELWDMVKEISLHVGGPAVGGILGYFTAMRRNNVLSDHLEAKSEALQLDALTRHFEALVEGYEKRIQDLTTEIDDLREEVKSLRRALDQRPRPH